MKTSSGSRHLLHFSFEPPPLFSPRTQVELQVELECQFKAIKAPAPADFC